MLNDPLWRLVALLLDDARHVVAIGVVDSSWLRAAAPTDRGGFARWQNARFDVPPTALRGGLAEAMPWAFGSLPRDHLFNVGYVPRHQPAWIMPPRLSFSRDFSS